MSQCSSRMIAITSAFVALYCLAVSLGPGLLLRGSPTESSGNSVQAQVSALPEG